MRGFLGVLIIAAAFVAGIAWFGGPPLAETLVEASLTNSGFAADELDVTVRSEPPLAVVVGRADRVQIEATGVRWNDLRAGSMSMRLDGVDLIGRTATTADGRLVDVELATTDGDPALVGITIAGPADRARTTVAIDEATVNRITLAAFEKEFGVRPDSAELVAPDGIRVQRGTLELSGTLRVDADGTLVVASSLGTVRLVEPDPSIPLRLSGVSVGPGGLELVGTLDLESLIR